MDRAKYGRLIFITGAILVLDQVSKLLILNSIPLLHSIDVIPGLFSITHIHNPGGAFGLLADHSLIVRKIVFLLMSSLAALMVLYFYHKTPPTHAWLAAAFAMVFGGAIGNLVDRFRFGKVVDFLDFYLGQAHWPAFNIADSAITVGMGIIILHMVFNRMPE